MTLHRKNLSLLKYFFSKNLNYLALKNTNFFKYSFSFFLQFGFLFIYKLRYSTLLFNIMFNSKPLVNHITLFLKNSNKVIFSKKIMEYFFFLNPSLLPLIYQNKQKLVSAPKQFIYKKKGIRLLGIIC